MSSKVYALYHRKPLVFGEQYELKISSDDIWDAEKSYLESLGSDILLYNDMVYLSLSREVLLKKAQEIKNEWIKSEQERLKDLINIEVGEWVYGSIEQERESLEQRIIRLIIEEPRKLEELRKRGIE